MQKRVNGTWLLIITSLRMEVLKQTEEEFPAM